MKFLSNYDYFSLLLAPVTGSIFALRKWKGRDNNLAMEIHPYYLVLDLSVSLGIIVHYARLIS